MTDPIKQGFIEEQLTALPHLIEADERHEQPDIGLCELVARHVAALRQDALHLVQRVEQLPVSWTRFARWC
jgi:hypothetical protein